MFNKVLITGGAGFIGHHLIDTFLAYPVPPKIFVIDNLSSKSPEKFRMDSNINFTFGNVEDIYTVQYISSTIKDINYIIHLASPASPLDFETRPMEIIGANIMGTRNMLELARHYDCPFLFASSSEVYGNVPSNQIPIKETYNGNVKTTGVRSVYDESKRAGEMLTNVYHKTYGLNTKIARIFNTYGPKMPYDGRVIQTFISCALDNKPLPVQGEGEQTRAFLYVSDLVDGLIKLARGKYNDPINLGSPTDIKIIDLATKIIDIMGRGTIEYVSRNKEDPDWRKPDIELAKTELSWEPKIDLEEGLKRTIEYYKIQKAAQLFF